MGEGGYESVDVITREWARGNSASGDEGRQNAGSGSLWYNAGVRYTGGHRAMVGDGRLTSQGQAWACRDLQQKARTPVRRDRKDRWLTAYIDKRATEFLRHGFREGFRLGYEGPRVRRWAGNLKSAKAHGDIVQTQLDNDVREGRMAGPVFDCPLQELIISTVGVVPKKANSV